MNCLLQYGPYHARVVFRGVLGKGEWMATTFEREEG